MIQIDKNDNNHIYITRGDTLIFDLQINDENGDKYVFKNSDVITFGIYKNLKDPAIILKDFNGNDTEKLRIEIGSLEMKIGDLINSPRNYFYEVTLNNETTVIGYTRKGAAKLTLLPEGSNVLGGVDSE